jgi:hypothetical protein
MIGHPRGIDARRGAATGASARRYLRGFILSAALSPDPPIALVPRLNLLLLLSALLSALTGAVSTVRAPTAAHAVAGAIASRTAAVRAARPAAARPAVTLADARRVGATLIVQPVAEFVPLYASRRRE